MRHCKPLSELQLIQGDITIAFLPFFDNHQHLQNLGDNIFFIYTCTCCPSASMSSDLFCYVGGNFEVWMVAMCIWSMSTPCVYLTIVCPTTNIMTTIVIMVYYWSSVRAYLLKVFIHSYIELRRPIPSRPYLFAHIS